MSDFCSNDGASRLQALIQDYWRKKGYDVHVELVHQGFVSTMRSSRFDIRSDMVNGMPNRIDGDKPAAP
ncbi:hypothetical protein [Parvularcula bermudensis]|nr:hypothetical protein [Parvularcula bermudensis]